MNRKEWRERKFKLCSVSTQPSGDLRAGLTGTLSDDEIRDIIKHSYGWIGTTNGEIARIIFEIACKIRNRIAQPESAKVIDLRENLDSAERRAEYLAKQLEEAELNKKVSHYRDMYSRIHKIHVEDVRRRKEVRRFRLANFSIEEMENEIARKKAIERKYKRMALTDASGQGNAAVNSPIAPPL